jgi:hypothetical protein
MNDNTSPPAAIEPAPSSLKLAEALRAAGLVSLADRAALDEFHDFRSPHDMPTTMLVELLEAAGHRGLAARVENGEFDATEAEAEEWAESPEGKAALGGVSPAVRVKLFGDA